MLQNWLVGYDKTGYQLALFPANHLKSKKKVKEHIAINGFPSHSYGTSLAICDHTVLPATQHK